MGVTGTVRRQDGHQAERSAAPARESVPPSRRLRTAVLTLLIVVVAFAGLSIAHAGTAQAVAPAAGPILLAGAGDEQQPAPRTAGSAGAFGVAARAAVLREPPVGTFTFGSAPTLKEDLPEAPVVVAPGDPVELSVAVDGDEAPTSVWQVSRDGTSWEDMPAGTGTEVRTPTRTVDGVGQVGRTVATLAFTAPEGGGTTFYRAVLSNRLGAITSAAARVVVGAPVDLDEATIEADPDEIAADGTSTSTLTISLVDAVGGAATGHSVRVAASAGTVTVPVDNGDGTYTSTLTSSTEMGPSTITFTVDGDLAPTDATVRFVAGEPSLTDSTIAADPGTIVVGGRDSAVVTVSLVDDHGHPVPGRRVVVTSSAGKLGTLVDRGDGTYATTLTSAVTLGVATLGFTVDGRPALATTSVAFVAGPPALDVSTISAAPTSIVADGASTSAVTVSLKDGSGVPLPGQDVVVSTDAGEIVADDVTGQRVTDNGDGTYSAVLRSSERLERARVSFAVGAGPVSPNTASVDFVVGPPALDRSTIAADPASIVADGRSTSTVTATVVDASGRALVGRDVVIAADRGDLTTTTDLGDGRYVATLTAPTAVGVSELRFTVDGNVADARGTVSFTPGAPSMSRSTIGAAPDRITADGADVSVVTVTLLDAHDNPVSGGDVRITSSAGDLTATTEVGGGRYTAAVSSREPGQSRLGFTLGTQVGDATALVRFAAGAPSLTDSTIVAEPDTIVVGARDSSVITVSLVDDHGHPVPGRRVAVTSTTGKLGPAIDNGDGTYTTTLTAAGKVGVATLRFTVDGRMADDKATVTFVAGPVSPAASTITAVPTSLEADGESTSAVTVRLRDTYNNPVTGHAVVITTTGGELTPTTGRGDGVYTATLTAPEAVGSALLGFTLDAVAVPDITTVVAFTTGDTSLTRSTIGASPDEITADGRSTSTVTVRVVDDRDNPVPGQDVVITSSAGSIGRTTDNGDGTYTATVTSPTHLDEATLGFSINGEKAPRTAQVAFVAGDPSDLTSTITADPNSLEADGAAESTITARVMDEHSNPVVGRDVVITTSGGSVGRTTDDGDGTHTATLRAPDAAGAATVGFTVDAAGGYATTTVAFTAGAAAPDRATIGASPASVTADGLSTSTITVALVDAHGNPVSGYDVSIDSPAGTVTRTTDEGDGIYTAVLTAPTEPGEATITFTIDGVRAPATTTVTFTAVEGGPGGPGDPDGPGDPGGPGDPDGPGEPGGPGDPEGPDAPGGPVDPVDPGAPGVPGDPDVGGGSSGAGSGNGTDVPGAVPGAAGGGAGPGLLAVTGSQVRGLVAVALGLLSVGLLLLAARRSRPRD